MLRTPSPGLPKQPPPGGLPRKIWDMYNTVHQDYQDTAAFLKAPSIATQPRDPLTLVGVLADATPNKFLVFSNNPFEDRSVPQRPSKARGANEEVDDDSESDGDDVPQ